jgi:hypothetical protein
MVNKNGHLCRPEEGSTAGRVTNGEDDAAAPGPDFLCIGMGKSGTGWLYDQCQHHPDFWMPPIKEVHYLDKAFPSAIAKKILRADREWRNQQRLKRGKRPLEDRDMEFVREHEATRHRPMNLEAYARLYRFKGQQLSGDITPSYGAMPEDFIARVMARFPVLKIILLLRDPVSRAWSHFCMKNRADRIPTEDLRQPNRFRALLQESKAVRTGSPAAIAQRWLDHVPPEQFRYYFFEDIVSDPETVRDHVMSFLDANTALTAAVDPSRNRKAEKPKLDITDEIQAILAEHFADEIATSAALFGSHAVNWAAKYGITVPTGPSGKPLQPTARS